MFELRTEYANQIINDKSIKLPRFQRKKSWDNNDRFELCISLYKDYPLGTIVVKTDMEENKPVKWLLDGRQRRDTLKDCQNPENIYRWAYSYLKLKNRMNVEEVEENFNKKIEEFIEQEDSKTDDDPDKKDEEFDVEAGEECEEDNVLYADQDESSSYVTVIKDNKLEELLEIIKVVHPIKSRKVDGMSKSISSGFSNPFYFTNYKLNYLLINPEDNKKYVDSDKLMEWIRGKLTSYSVDDMTEDIFCEWFDSPTPELKDQIYKNWDNIKKSLKIAENIKNHLESAKIAQLELQKDCSSSDAKKIFEIINTKGTPLTAAEILSAKPSWNKVVEGPRDKIVKNKDELYKNISDIENGDVVRWDVVATFTDRIDSSLDFILGNWKKCDSDTLEKKITLGFKIWSGYYKNAISKDSISDLANCPECNEDSWNSEVMENQLKHMGKALMDDDFFKYVSRWQISLMSMTSDAVALNYLLIVFKDWIAKDEPKSGKISRIFLKNARILFDKSVFEYVSGVWKGSSDSKLAKNLKNLQFTKNGGFDMICRDRWIKLVEDAIFKNKIEELDVTDSKLKALLYYYYFLSKKSLPIDPTMSGIDVDHIIPKARFEETSRYSKFETSLVNIAILPKKDNIKKGDRMLSDITDDWLKQQIQMFEDIEIEDFVYYKSADDVERLLRVRGDKLKKTLTEDRENTIGAFGD